VVDQSNPLLVSRFQSFSQAASVIVMAIGGFVLIGWTLDIPLLKSILPGWSTLKPNAAFAFILSGLSLWLLMSTDVSEKRPVEESLRFASQYARSLVEKKLWQVGAFKDVEEVTVHQSTTTPDCAVD